MSFSTAASACAMKSGTAATGTETSCLIEPPSGFCASGRNLADMPKGARLVDAVGDRGILDEALFRRRRRAPSPSSRAGLRAIATTAAAARTRDACRCSGSRTPVPCLSAISMPARGISSKLVAAPPVRLCIEIEKFERSLAARAGR